MTAFGELGEQFKKCEAFAACIEAMVILWRTIDRVERRTKLCEDARRGVANTECPAPLIDLLAQAALGRGTYSRLSA